MERLKLINCVDFVGTSCGKFSGVKNYISTGAVNTNFIESTYIEVVDWINKPSRANLIVEENDIIFAKMQSTEKTLLINKELTNHIYSTGFCAVRAKNNLITAKYLYYFLTSESFLNQKDQNCSGATQKAITNSGLSKINICVHSIDHQNKLVKLLDKICTIIDLRKQQIKKLDELVKSRFVELFGDPISNPKGWKTEKAETHIDLLSGFPFDSSLYTESGVNICGGLIIMPQRIDWNDCKHWCSIEGYEEYTLKENDIVIALDRPWISEGFKIAMVDAEHLPALLIQRTARIRAIDINQLYLMYCFLLGGFDKHCNVTGSLVPHISAKDIRSFSIMLPPLELQEQFATFIEQTDKSKFEIQKSLEKLEILKKSLMQQYFG